MNKPLKMKELSVQERPYEKFEKFGAEALTDAELLSIILRSGTRGTSSLALAKQILEKEMKNSGLSALFHMELSELEHFNGIGRVKAMQLKCICEISKRISQDRAKKSLSFNRPSSIAEYYMERLRHEEQELVYCMMLDTRNALICDLCVTKGTVNTSLISPREIFIKAVSHRAVSIVLVHNHPSGDPSPSEEDIDITQRLYDAGNLIGISLLDHIIIGNNAYISIMAESRLINY